MSLTKPRKQRAPMPNTRSELARLRRMADAYAKGQLIQYGLCCFECNTGNGKHTATCDVAAHLDLPREKGEGE